MESSRASAQTYVICRHIKTNGRRCQAPALTGSSVCYFHRILRRSHWPAHAFPTAHLSTTPQQVGPLLLEPGPAPSPAFTLPPLEDAESIQLAISTLFSAMTTGDVDPTHVRNLLYALQLASFNVRTLAHARRHALASTRNSRAGHDDTESDTGTIVRRVVRTRDGRTLAAPGDGNGIPSEADRPKTINERLLEALLEGRADRQDPEDPANQPKTPIV